MIEINLIPAAGEGIRMKDVFRFRRPTVDKRKKLELMRNESFMKVNVDV